MFILFVALFIFVLTVWSSFIVFWVLSLFLFILLILFGRSKYILYLGLAVVFSFVAVSIKQYTYISKIPSDNNIQTIFADKPYPQWNYYLWTGSVIEKQKDWRYLFQDILGRKYFLNTKKKYQPWDEVFLQAYYQVSLTGLLPIYDFGKQFKNINITGDFSFWKLSFFPRLDYEFDFPKRMMMKWYYGTLREKNSSIISQHKESMSFLQKTRFYLQTKVKEIYWENRTSGLILWMIIWDKSEIPVSDYETFISSGLVHIIAVSGGNIVMIVVFLWFVLFFVPFYLRNVIVIFVVVAYSFLCGMDSSVFRAMLMGSMSLLALFWGRELNIWRVMASAFLIMVFVNPYLLVYDVGFLLSFSAIVGLIWFDKIWKSVFDGKRQFKNKILLLFQVKSLKFIQNYFWPTIWATIGVMPVIMFFMWKTNLVWIFANIFILPIVPFVMIYGVLSVFLYDILGRDWIIWIEKVLVDYIYRVSEVFSSNWVFLEMTWQDVKFAFLILSILIFVWVRLRLFHKVWHN